MKKLLLITGDLATGKSTLANILAERYSVNEYNKDTIKEVLGETIGFSNREENLKLSQATVEIMFFIFSEFTRFGKDIILEANFRQEELNKIHTLAKEHHYDVLTLSLRADDDILYSRYMNRMKNENRHPVHLSATLDIFEDFKQYLAKLRKVEIAGEVLHIDANDFTYQSNENLLSKIDGFMNENGKLL